MTTGNASSNFWMTHCLLAASSILTFSLQQQQQHNLQARSYNLQAMRQAQHQMAMGDFGDVPQDPNGARTKWPFIMNMGGGNQGLQVKVWLPDSLVDKLAKRKS